MGSRSGHDGRYLWLLQKHWGDEEGRCGGRSGGGLMLYIRDIGLDEEMKLDEEDQIGQ